MAYPEKGATYDHNPRFLRDLKRAEGGPALGDQAASIGRLAKTMRDEMKASDGTGPGEKPQREDLRPGMGRQLDRATGLPEDPVWPSRMEGEPESPSKLESTPAEEA